MTADPDDPTDEPSFIPVGHLAAVGRLANAWAYLEFAVDKATWALAGVPDMVGACMTAQMLSIQPKFRALIAVAELRGLSAPTIKDLRRFQQDRIGGLQEGRNRAVHDTRVIHRATGGVSRLQITAQGPLVFDFQPEPVSELHATRKKIEALTRDFIQLREAVLSEYRALPADAGRQLLDIRPGGAGE